MKLPVERLNSRLVLLVFALVHILLDLPKCYSTATETDTRHALKKYSCEWKYLSSAGSCCHSVKQQNE